MWLSMNWFQMTIIKRHSDLGLFERKPQGVNRVKYLPKSASQGTRSVGLEINSIFQGGMVHERVISYDWSYAANFAGFQMKR